MRRPDKEIEALTEIVQEDAMALDHLAQIVKFADDRNEKFEEAQKALLDETLRRQILEIMLIKHEWWASHVERACVGLSQMLHRAYQSPTYTFSQEQDLTVVNHVAWTRETEFDEMFMKEIQDGIAERIKDEYTVVAFPNRERRLMANDLAYFSHVSADGAALVEMIPGDEILGMKGLFIRAVVRFIHMT